VNDCVIKAVALALADVPAANCYWDAAQGAAVPAGSGGRVGWLAEWGRWLSGQQPAAQHCAAVQLTA